MERETAGWDVPRRSAAFAMLPASTTDMSTRISCSLRRRFVQLEAAFDAFDLAHGHAISDLI